MVAKCAAACSSSVDLPMPGSPPSSTSEPGNDAAAEHAIELADARREASGVGRFNFCVQLRRRGCTELRVPVVRSRPPARLRARHAPRQTSSRRRIRCTCPSTWAIARRIPGRRRRLWVVSFYSSRATKSRRRGAQTMTYAPGSPCLRGSYLHTDVRFAIQYDRRPRRGSCRSPPPFRARRSAATIRSP